MKSFFTSAATAIVSLCGMIFIATKALELPAMFDSLWAIGRQYHYDPLVIAATLLGIVLIVGRSVDFLRRVQERRESQATATDSGSADPSTAAPRSTA